MVSQLECDSPSISSFPPPPRPEQTLQKMCWMANFLLPVKRWSTTAGLLLWALRVMMSHWVPVTARGKEIKITHLGICDCGDIKPLDYLQSRRNPGIDIVGCLANSSAEFSRACSGKRASTSAARDEIPSSLSVLEILKFAVSASAHLIPSPFKAGALLPSVCFTLRVRW